MNKARTARLAAIIFFGAALSAAACSDEKAKNGGLPAPMPFAPPGGFNLDAGSGQAGPKPSIAKQGEWLVDPGGNDGTLVSQAVVTLTPAKKDGKGAGTIRFAAAPDGLQLKADLTGLTFLSSYAMYVHVTGDCSADDLSSAGPTFNFDGSSLDPPDVKYGELGDLKADVGGEGKASGKVPGAAIQGPYSILGRTVVLHAMTGDANNPSFSTGQMLACGVVGVAAAFAAQ